MGNLIGKLQQRVCSRLYLDTKPDHSAAIFLAGVGRSGTTWVADIINYRNDHRVMFEPFYPQKVSMVSHFRYRQYLRPDNDDPRYLDPVRAIVCGRVRNPWIDQQNRKLWASRRLIKDIRANLLLYWMHQRFPDMPLILILRHPCAVACSKLKLGWGTHLNDFLEQAELMEDYLKPFRSALVSAATDFDKHVLLWCVENYVPLRQFRRGEVHLAFYELFCADPKTEIQRLFDHLKLPVDDTILENLSKPSSMVRPGSAVLSGGDLIDSWRREVSPEQVSHSLELLGLFGLEKVYAKGSLPDVGAAYAIMQSA